ncbi:hypothetical protein H310_10689 [Aphanomyces invadans]|uniref:Uncharacterized protein n=1 Tax=Aphanomyces invadans TaxID=157072 RepID=A0A024TQY3_9STRA|nr:hypothetical protein H310_10689 [Aphanomyces invadans]ETV96041.1 hypothetical protein H310_10689 [Aphanomyces invadans]|eukprot:XP_008875352.1 hypothetical protein H310_10689 [Aphanomyces invadans]
MWKLLGKVGEKVNARRRAFDTTSGSVQRRRMLRRRCRDDLPPVSAHETHDCPSRNHSGQWRMVRQEGNAEAVLEIKIFDLVRMRCCGREMGYRGNLMVAKCGELEVASVDVSSSHCSITHPHGRHDLLPWTWFAARGSAT